jgi:hypothetical protein
MALAKLLQYGVNNNDDRLNEITVRGDEVFNENGGGPRTRSSRAARPEQWTSVPLLAKIFKLLLVEMNNQLELHEESEDEEDDEEGGEWDDDESQESDFSSGHNVSGGERIIYTGTGTCSGAISC